MSIERVIAMAARGLRAVIRVTKMLAERVTETNYHEGFTANIVTSMLVSSKVLFGLPMSTTSGLSFFGRVNLFRRNKGRR